MANVTVPAGAAGPRHRAVCDSTGRVGQRPTAPAQPCGKGPGGQSPGLPETGHSSAAGRGCGVKPPGPIKGRAGLSAAEGAFPRPHTEGGPGFVLAGAARPPLSGPLQTPRSSNHQRPKARTPNLSSRLCFSKGMNRTGAKESPCKAVPRPDRPLGHTAPGAVASRPPAGALTTAAAKGVRPVPCTPCPVLSQRQRAAAGVHVHWLPGPRGLLAGGSAPTRGARSHLFPALRSGGTSHFASESALGQPGPRSPAAPCSAAALAPTGGLVHRGSGAGTP